MNATILLTAALAFFFQGPPLQTGPLRNTFLVSAETVVDNAIAVDPAAPDTEFDPHMKMLKQSQATLKTMADDEREKDIADESFNMIFSISACHIQARDAARLATCKAQVSTSITNMMTRLNHHKQNGIWTEGPPA